MVNRRAAGAGFEELLANERDFVKYWKHKVLRAGFDKVHKSSLEIAFSGVLNMEEQIFNIWNIKYFPAVKFMVLS